MCGPMIAMALIMAAMAAKQSMDAKRNAAMQRKNAIAQQKVEQEALLKKRAEQGDADAMLAFERMRAQRVDAAKIMVAKGEQGATTGNFQVDTMLQGLGFGSGLQNTADRRTADARISNTDLQIKSSGVNFTSRMRTINASDPTALATAFNVGMAGASGYYGAAPKGGPGGGGGGDPGGAVNQGTGGSRIRVGR